MQSNYSLFKDLPEFNSGKIKEKFTPSISLSNILENLDSFKQTMNKQNDIWYIMINRPHIKTMNKK